jgi:hypothetical protein
VHVPDLGFAESEFFTSESVSVDGNVGPGRNFDFQPV